MTKKKVIIITVIAVAITNMITILIMGLGLRFLLTGSLMDVSGVSYAKIEKYNNIKNLIKQKYVDNVDDNQLMEGSIKGLAEAVNDPYTVYMNKDEFENMQIYTNANYAGIGIVLGVDPTDNLLLVSEVFENSPSEKANILPGDKIVKVNDLVVDGDNFDKAVQNIRGPKGTKVKLAIIRKDVTEPVEIDVVRDDIEINTVKSKMLKNNIGYIRIVQFGEKTSAEFKKAISKLENEGMKKLVIDLRDNPGGLLDQVVGVSQQIIPNKLVVYTVDKEGNRQDYPTSVDKINGNINNNKELNIPLVLLVNQRSASASEIFAGFIKDYQKGLLVGEKTYGKGVVQSVFPLPDGSGVKITTSRYYTPNGISIHKVGVQPDVKVELKERDKAISKLTYVQDTQLQKAIEILNKK